MRVFPILMTSSIRGPEETRAIPWDMIAPHEVQALINHGQTLEKLAARGGVVPAEALAILEDRKYQPLQLTAAALMLKAKVEAWTAPTGDVFKLIDDLRAGRITPRPHHFNKIEIALQAALGSTPEPQLTADRYVHVGYQWRARATALDPWSPWRDGPCPTLVPKGSDTQERRLFAPTEPAK